MSRTFRNNPDDDRWFRRPKTRRERALNAQLEAEERAEDYHVAKGNRRHRWIPDEYSDLPISAS